MIGVAVLGSTGSIGVNTLDVLRRHRGRFRVVALSAGSNVQRLQEQCLEWRPPWVAMADAAAARQLRARLADGPAARVQVLAGADAIAGLAAHAEVNYVMAAIVGAAGLAPTLAAARAGKRVLLANKEALVMSGQLLMDAVRSGGAELLPVDSEHNAVFQCLPAGVCLGETAAADVARILLTASGGPFRQTPPEALATVTPEQACRHPTWVMGRKISIDSATMMNKGLELIEACWMFGLPPQRVEIVIHPQSIVHSLVEYTDGSMLAQLGSPDMRVPIAHALAWPGQRLASGAPRLDLAGIARLEFQPPDAVRFPCLRLARDAMSEGGTATTILNAANEVAVSGFLAGHIAFTGIAPVIEDTLNRLGSSRAESLEAILAADGTARSHAGQLLQEGRL